MGPLFRRAGRRLREYVRPLVGFWDLVARLDALNERIGRLESATAAFPVPVPSDFSPLAHRLDLLSNALTSRDGALVTTVAKEVDRLDGYLAYHAAMVRDDVATLRAHQDAKLHEGLEALGAQQERALNRTAEALRTHHATMLRDNMETLRASHETSLVSRTAPVHDGIAAIQATLDALRQSAGALAARPLTAHTAPSLDAIIIGGDHDLIVPTEEAGLLVYILRHGLDTIEPGVRALIRDRLRPGGVAVDAGANIGIHSITMASAVGPQGRVLCFEPLPHLCKGLQRTLRLNGLADWVQVHQVALADETGEAPFNRAAHGPMSSLYALPEALGTEAVQVRLVTLDQMITPGERVDLVKMDVEGAEPRVWRGMQRVLRDNPEIDIIMEWSTSHFTRTGANPEEFMAEIRAAGFIPYVISGRLDAPERLAPLIDGEATVEAQNLLLTRAAIGQAEVPASNSAAA